MTEQEMFTKAVVGLRAQGWARAVVHQPTGEVSCVYHDKATGRRCAWGHVDPEGTQDLSTDFNGPDLVQLVFSKSVPIGYTNVTRLHAEKRGVAGTLTMSEVQFARNLQSCHDGAVDGQLEERFREFGKTYALTWPEEPAEPEPVS